MHIEVHASYTSDCRWKRSNQWSHFLVSAETPLWVIQNLAPFTPPCEFLVAVTVWNLSGFIWCGLHQQEESTRGSQLRRAWREKWSREGWLDQWTEIPEKQRESYWTVAQWLMQSSCHDLVWRILTFVTFIVPFSHPPLFFPVFTVSPPCWRSGRQSHELA